MTMWEDRRGLQSASLPARRDRTRRTKVCAPPCSHRASVNGSGAAEREKKPALPGLTAIELRSADFNPQSGCDFGLRLRP